MCRLLFLSFRKSIEHQARHGEDQAETRLVRDENFSRRKIARFSRPPAKNSRLDIYFYGNPWLFLYHSIPRFLLMLKDQHIERIGNRIVMLQGNIAGVSKADQQFARVGQLRKWSSNVRCRFEKQKLPFDGLTRPPGCQRVLGRQDSAASFKPWPASSVTITRGTWATPFLPPCPRCSTKSGPLDQSGAGRSPGTQSRTPMPPV